MKLRFTFISFGIRWKRDAILRSAAKRKTRKSGKERHSSQLAVLGGRVVSRAGLAEFWGTEDKPTTVGETKTVVHVVTKTVAKVVEKPFIHPLHTS